MDTNQNNQNERNPTSLEALNAARARGDTVGDEWACRAAEQRAVADAMKVGAETARTPRRVGGLDGEGWAAAVKRDPMRTLPPGAGSLIVGYYETLVASRRDP